MMPYRPEWWPPGEGGGGCSLFVLCDYVHSITTEQLYPYFPGDLDLAVRSLEWARDNWKHPSSMYDRAVLTLVTRTLNERNPKPKGPPDFICTQKIDEPTPTEGYEDE